MRHCTDSTVCRCLIIPILVFHRVYVIIRSYDHVTVISPLFFLLRCQTHQQHLKSRMAQLEQQVRCFCPDQWLFILSRHGSLVLVLLNVYFFILHFKVRRWYPTVFSALEALSVYF